MTLSANGSKSPRKAISAARLRAQRANAQRSTGPRTRTGRRRSALNRLGVPRREIAWYDASEPQNTREYLRVWRDVWAAFWFVKPELWRDQPLLELYLRGAAQAWAGKLIAARKGIASERMNAGIHYHLAYFLFQLRLWNRKCDYWLRKEFGSDGYGDVGKLREHIEAHLSSFRNWPRLVERAKRAKRGVPPGGTLSDQTQIAIWLKKWDLIRDSGPRSPESSGYEAKPVSGDSSGG